MGVVLVVTDGNWLKSTAGTVCYSQRFKLILSIVSRISLRSQGTLG